MRETPDEAMDDLMIHELDDDHADENWWGEMASVPIRMDGEWYVQYPAPHTYATLAEVPEPAWEVR